VGTWLRDVTELPRRRSLLLWAVIATIVVEVFTACLRFHGDISAVEFNKSAPLLLQIHHMFYCLPDQPLTFV
jgi:hypothetical protein